MRDHKQYEFLERFVTQRILIGNPAGFMQFHLLWLRQSGSILIEGSKVKM